MRRIGHAVMLLATLLFASAADVAQTMSTHDEALIEFARDFSGDDPKVMAKVRGFIATPPTKIEDIGFHGSSDGLAPRRQFLATVSALSDAGHLHASEDKYSNELIHILDRDDKIDLAAMPANVQKFWRAIDENPDDLSQRAFRKLAWETYGEATRAIEAQLAARGKAILSIDATDGDTMFFAVVDKAVADRWRNVGLGEFEPYDGGIRDPMWDRFWFFLAYSVGPSLADGDKQAVPPGTRDRATVGKLNPYKLR